MAAAWEVCTVCASVVADITAHRTWHETGLPGQIQALITDPTPQALEG